MSVPDQPQPTPAAPPARRIPWRVRYPGQSARAVAFYKFIQFLSRTAFTLIYRLRVFGLDNIPASGACIIVCNHNSHLDPPAVGGLPSRRAIHFVAKAELFKSRAFGGFIRALNSIPIKQDGSADIESIREILARLNSGAAVLLFPEGTRSPSHEMLPLQRGIGLLVKRAKCPVIPAAIVGSREAWPPGQKLPSLWGRTIAIRFGAPIPPEELTGPDALDRLKREILAQRAELFAMRSTPGSAPLAHSA